jgi:hypothetical protein
MNKLLTALVCAFLLLATGCFFGDAFVHRTVSLSFPVPQQQTNVSLSVNDTEVQEALKLVDDVLVSDGYIRDSNPLTREDRARGLIAFYGVCGVGLKDNRLDVDFVEPHRRHFSAPVRKVIEQLKDKLSSRYGAERVKVED